MGNPSKWISELKKGDFRPSEIFFRKIIEKLKKHFLIIHDFSKKILNKAPNPLFGLRNPVGWVCHVVLALNQLKRPKNGQIQLKKPKNSIVENLKFFDLIFRWYFPFSMLILWLQN